MQRMRVGVLRGGPSSEYNVSLKTGASILQHLDQEKYQPIDVFIDREGTWHVRGTPTEPRRALQNVDVVLNAMHGEFGEDGTAQQILDASGVPYAGTRALGSRLAMNKLAAKKALAELGVLMPRHLIVDREDDLHEAAEHMFHTLSQPVVVKPVGSGSSVGVSIVTGTIPIADALEAALAISPRALVEEYVPGREATCGVLELYRDKDTYALPLVEIVPPKAKEFFDYEAKYSGETEEICPGRFSNETKREIERLAQIVHRALGLRHYSRSDFIVGRDGKAYFLEVNTLPGLTSESLYPKAVDAVGCTFPQLLDHLIWLAYKRL